MNTPQTLDALRARLARVPDPPPLVASPSVAPAVEDSVRYLASDAALRSIDADTYWPKWDSPWWHMLLLYELGEARRIPARVAAAMVEGLAALPIKTFPLREEDVPPGTDPYRDVSCHCALGSIDQVLAACGLDVDRALPWIEPWFLRYQMADGGLNCDSDAYLQPDECPSSMVGTVAPFEAMLRRRPGAWTPAQRAFLDRAAGCLIERALVHGSPTAHNAAERASAPSWLAPCFPRFYFYDVLRGLSALVRWAEASGGAIPLRAVAPVVEHLSASFPDGVVRLQRRAVEGRTTLLRAPDGAWQTRQPATTFALLDAVSAVGQACPHSTRAWAAARAGIGRLADAGQITTEA